MNDCYANHSGHNNNNKNINNFVKKQNIKSNNANNEDTKKENKEEKEDNDLNLKLELGSDHYNKSPNNIKYSLNNKLSSIWFTSGFNKENTNCIKKIYTKHHSNLNKYDTVTNKSDFLSDNKSNKKLLDNPNIKKKLIDNPDIKYDNKILGDLNIQQNTNPNIKFTIWSKNCYYKENVNSIKIIKDKYKQNQT